MTSTDLAAARQLYVPVTIGIDPGLSGALALLAGGRLLDVHDMPIGTAGAVSAQQLADLEPWHDSGVFGPAIIEDVHSMPKQGVASSFKFGRSKGVVEGVMAGARRPIVYVAPHVWKRDLKLSRDKGASRQRALELWPNHAHLFKRAKDDGRAEAALIAYWATTNKGD